MSLNSFQIALDHIKNDELIILPTDTVYGLLCRYDSEKAVKRIYSTKKRDKKKPLILLGYNWKALKRFVDLRKVSIEVRDKIPLKKWPGAFTLILPASKKVPSFLNKGYKTVGLRIPDNKFLLDLLKQCPGKVLASTSANLSGMSPRYPQKEILKKVKLFIKAKKNEMSFKPSQIIEVKKEDFKVLR